MKYLGRIFQVSNMKYLGLRIIECVADDYKYFINLEELDISENEVIIDQLTSFPCLKTLRICANNIQQISLTDVNTFLHLKKLDLSFNYLDTSAIESLQYIPNLRYHAHPPIVVNSHSPTTS